MRSQLRPGFAPASRPFRRARDQQQDRVAQEDAPGQHHGSVPHIDCKYRKWSHSDLAADKIVVLDIEENSPEEELEREKGVQSLSRQLQQRAATLRAEGQVYSLVSEL